MLNVFRCPNCGKKLKTDQAEGHTIPCPYCKEVFTISADDVVFPDPGREMLFRLAVPLGYVLFVAVPMGLTLLYFATREEKKAVADAPAAEEERRPAPKPAPRPPRKEKGAKGPGPAWNDPDPDQPLRPPTGETLALAPHPRELPDPPAPVEPVEVAVAPEPREIVWKLPPSDYVSPWQKFGAVDLRVAGLAVTKVPLIDGKERVRETAQPMLVVVVEVRANAAGKKRELLSWTHGQFNYASAFPASGKDLPRLDVPLGSKVRSGLPLQQPLPDDGEPVRDILVFAVPPDGSGELSLRLDAERCGERGDIWFKIPATAFKK